MPRVTLTPDNAPGAYPPAGVVVNFAAADASNLNQFILTGNELVIAFNSGATGRTVTITSVADRFGRTGTITTEAIAAGVYRMYGPFTNAEGWKQTDGFLYLEASHAEVKFAIIKLPATR